MPADSSSSDSTPSQFTGIDISSLCSLLNRPQILTGVFRDILVRHFSSASTIENPVLKEYLWSDGDDTGILIESVHRWRPSLTEHRPAVIIKRNSYQNMRRGIGDIHQGPAADEYGDPHYATFWTGSHTLFCISGSGANAELLGSEVQRELTEFAPVLAKSLGLKRLQVTQVGAIAELEEAQENFTVPVTVGYTYEERWKIRKQAPLLSHVSLSYILEC